jgi:hypothetical protein
MQNKKVFLDFNDTGFQYSDMNGHGNTLSLCNMYIKSIGFFRINAIRSSLLWTRGMGQAAKAGRQMPEGDSVIKPVLVLLPLLDLNLVQFITKIML